MNCPSCGAPMQMQSGGDSFVCPYCRSVYLPDKNDDGVRVLGESAGETCPVCAIPLQKAALQEVQIRYCTRCRGMLIPMNSFAALLDAVRAAGDAAVAARAPEQGELQQRLNCPHCHLPMDTHVYAGPGNVVIEDCERCMLNWLDHGKLQRIADGVDSLRDVNPWN